MAEDYILKPLTPAMPDHLIAHMRELLLWINTNKGGATAAQYEMAYAIVNVLMEQRYVAYLSSDTK